MENNLKKCDHCKRDAVVIIDNYKFECAECHIEVIKSKEKGQIKRKATVKTMHWGANNAS